MAPKPREQSDKRQIGHRSEPPRARQALSRERGTPKDIEITTIRAGLLIFLVPHQGLLKIFMVKYQILIYYTCTRIYQGG